MNDLADLHLYEQILLLALRNEQGTVSGHFPEYAIAGSILAELELLGRIGRMQDHPTEVGILDPSPFEDPVIDECLGVMAASKRRLPLDQWVAKLSSVHRLRHKAAQRLCDRGILKADERKILKIFTQRIYPEINPEPERALIGALEAAVFGDSLDIDPRLVTLIALAHASGLLALNLGKKEVKARENHITALIAGDRVGKATRHTIETMQAVLFTVMMIPPIVS